MAASIPARLTWAVEQLQLRPDDRILEIGCGPGVLASLMCERLKGGSVTAIDRSAHAITTARKRNQQHGDKATFRVASFEKATFDGNFDKIVAVHVNLFWTQPGVGVRKLKDLLARRGAVYLVYQGPASMRPQRVVPAIERSFRADGLTEIEVRTEELLSGPAVCVIARPGAVPAKKKRAARS